MDNAITYLTDVLTRIVNGHPNRDIDQLLPWAYGKQGLKAVAQEQRLQIIYTPAVSKEQTS